MRGVFLDIDTLDAGDLDLAPLQAQLTDLTCYPATSPDQVAERIAGADIVFINKVRLTADNLAAAKKVRLVCLAATGTDNVDLAAATKAGIVVCNIRNYCTPSVVQHVFALLLSLNQHLDSYRQAVRDGDWALSGQFCLLTYPLHELRGKTIGIVGYGALGRAVGQVAAAFGMQVLAARRPYDPADNAGPQTSQGPERVGLGRLLQTADVISLHCPLNPDTERLIDAAALATMRQSAILINTARGGLVDSAALIAALNSGQIAGAGIDVLSEEPPISSEPLIASPLPNLLVTPHMAWAARESRQRAVDCMAANVAAFGRGNPVNNVN